MNQALLHAHQERAADLEAALLQMRCGASMASLRRAENHRGWEVQMLTENGWVAVNSLPFVTRELAEAYLACCDATEAEYRIYESLHPRRILPEPEPFWPLRAV